uniref:Uncharacterized protein n=1 Tax=Siphoviridae sp. ctoiA13 TaxID=2826462 RepID=A0A8S5QXN7_9CAUD|nr:MAG TPA: hypothetical protein [Siphoviridae sp. ctoiA13]
MCKVGDIIVVENYKSESNNKINISKEIAL